MVLVDSELVLMAWRLGVIICGSIILFFVLALVLINQSIKIQLFKRFLKDKNLVSEYVEWNEKRNDLKKELELM